MFIGLVRYFIHLLQNVFGWESYILTPAPLYSHGIFPIELVIYSMHLPHKVFGWEVVF